MAAGRARPDAQHRRALDAHLREPFQLIAAQHARQYWQNKRAICHGMLVRTKPLQHVGQWNANRARMDLLAFHRVTDKPPIPLVWSKQSTAEGQSAAVPAQHVTSRKGALARLRMSVRSRVLRQPSPTRSLAKVTSRALVPSHRTPRTLSLCVPLEHRHHDQAGQRASINEIKAWHGCHCTAH